MVSNKRLTNRLSQGSSTEKYLSLCTLVKECSVH